MRQGNTRERGADAIYWVRALRPAATHGRQSHVAVVAGPLIFNQAELLQRRDTNHQRAALGCQPPCLRNGIKGRGVLAFLGVDRLGLEAFDEIVGYINGVIRETHGPR